jgi:hypothetical protein
VVAASLPIPRRFGSSHYDPTIALISRIGFASPGTFCRSISAAGSTLGLGGSGMSEIL